MHLHPFIFYSRALETNLANGDKIMTLSPILHSCGLDFSITTAGYGTMLSHAWSSSKIQLSVCFHPDCFCGMAKSFPEKRD